MRSPCMNGVTLTLVPSTNLYKSSDPGPGENMLFLRWSTENPLPSLTLEETWADSGPPPIPGYFVFLNTMPTNQDAPNFEKDLRDVVPAPTNTGFVWAVYTTGAASVSVQTLLSIKLNSSNLPCVDGNTLLALLPGLRGVGFGDLSPVIAIYRDDCITGFSTTYPPVAGSEPPRGPGVALPMLGKGVGCVQFAGLTNALVASKTEGISARKSLVQVSIDPLHPLDTGRNYQIFTGQDYILTEEDGVYHITPVT